MQSSRWGCCIDATYVGEREGDSDLVLCEFVELLSTNPNADKDDHNDVLHSNHIQFVYLALHSISTGCRTESHL